MTRARIGSISPSFIVASIPKAIAFYRDRLDFEVTYVALPEDPFFAIVERDGAMIMLKDVGVEPLPNAARHRDAPWDAYLYVPDPDALAAEFASRDVAFAKPLRDTEEGLRGFVLHDADGYVLFFGRPRP